MKNNKQLLNKENWIKYLDVAQENDLTNNAIANDIVSNIERVLGEREEDANKRLKEYKLNYKSMEQIHNTLDNAIKRLEELIKK